MKWITGEAGGAAADGVPARSRQDAKRRPGSVFGLDDLVGEVRAASVPARTEPALSSRPTDAEYSNYPGEFLPPYLLASGSTSNGSHETHAAYGDHVRLKILFGRWVRRTRLARRVRLKVELAARRRRRADGFRTAVALGRCFGKWRLLWREAFDRNMEISVMLAKSRMKVALGRWAGNARSSAARRFQLSTALSQWARFTRAARLSEWRSRLHRVQEARYKFQRSLLLRGFRAWRAALVRRKSSAFCERQLHERISRERLRCRWRRWRASFVGNLKLKSRLIRMGKDVLREMRFQAKTGTSAKQFARGKLLSATMRLWKTTLRRRRQLREESKDFLERRRDVTLSNALHVWISSFQTRNAERFRRANSLGLALDNWKAFANRRARARASHTWVLDIRSFQLKATAFRFWQEVLFDRIHDQMSISRAIALDVDMKRRRALRQWHQCAVQQAKTRTRDVLLRKRVQLLRLKRWTRLWSVLSARKRDWVQAVGGRIAVKKHWGCWRRVLASEHQRAAEAVRKGKSLESKRLERYTFRWRMACRAKIAYSKFRLKKRTALQQEAWRHWRTAHLEINRVRQCNKRQNAFMLEKTWCAWRRQTRLSSAVGNISTVVVRHFIKRWTGVCAGELKLVKLLRRFKSEQVVMKWRKHAAESKAMRTKSASLQNSANAKLVKRCFRAWILRSQHWQRQWTKAGRQKSQRDATVQAELFGGWLSVYRKVSTLRKARASVMESRALVTIRSHFGHWLNIKNVRMVMKRQQCVRALRRWSSYTTRRQTVFYNIKKFQAIRLKYNFYTFRRKCVSAKILTARHSDSLAKAQELRNRHLLKVVVLSWRQQLDEIAKLVQYGELVRDQLRIRRYRRMLRGMKRYSQAKREERTLRRIGECFSLRKAISAWRLRSSVLRREVQIEERLRERRRLRLLGQSLRRWKRHPLVWRALRRVLSTILLPPLRQGWNTWRECQNREKLVQEAALVSRRRRKCDALELWLARAKEKRKRKAKLVNTGRQVSLRAGLRLKGRALTSWRTSFSRISQFRTRMKILAMRRMTSGESLEALSDVSGRRQASSEHLEASSDTSRKNILSGNRLTEIMTPEECMRRLLFGKSIAVFRRWQANARFHRATRGNLSKAIVHRQNYVLLRCFLSWWKELHLGRLTSQFEAGKYQCSLRFALLTWRQRVTKRQRSRRKKETLEAIQRASLLRSTFSSWRLQNSRAVTNRTKGGVLERRVTANILHSSLDKWVQAYRKRTSKGYELVRTMLLLKRSRIFTKWLQMACWRIRIRRGMVRLLSRPRERSWEAWRTAFLRRLAMRAQLKLVILKRQRECVRICFSAWVAKSRTVQKRRRDVGIGMAIFRMRDHRTLRDAFFSWKTMGIRQSWLREALHDFKLNNIRPRMFRAWKRYSRNSKLALKHLVAKRKAAVITAWKRALFDRTRLRRLEERAVVLLHVRRVVVYLNRWSQYIYRKRLNGMVLAEIPRQRIRKLKAAVSSWHSHARESVRERKMAEGFADSSRIFRLKHALNAWKDSAENLHAERLKGARADLYCRGNIAFKAFARWNRVLHSRLRTSIFLERLGEQTRRMHLARSIQRWQHYVLQSRLLEFKKRQRSKRESLVLRVWHSEVKLCRYERGRLLRLRSNHMNRWHSLLDRISELEEKGVQHAGVRQMNIVKRSLALWRGFAVLHRRRRRRCLRSVRAHWLQSLVTNRRRKRALTTSFSHWNSRLGVLRQKDNDAKASIESKRVARALERWTMWSSSRKSLREASARALTKRLRVIFTTMALYCREQKLKKFVRLRRLSGILRAWTRRGKVMKRFREIGEAIETMRRRKLVQRSLRAWAGRGRRATAQRNALNEFLVEKAARDSKRLLGNAFRGWLWGMKSIVLFKRKQLRRTYRNWRLAHHYVAVERAELLLLLKRSIGSKRFAWRAWTLAHDLVKEVVRVGMVYRSHRENLTLGRCFRAMKVYSERKAEGRRKLHAVILNTFDRNWGENKKKRVLFLWLQSTIERHRTRISAAQEFLSIKQERQQQVVFHSWRRQLVFQTRVRTFFFRIQDRRLASVLRSWVRATKVRLISKRRAQILRQAQERRIVSIIFVHWRTCVQARNFDQSLSSNRTVGPLFTSQNGTQNTIQSFHNNSHSSVDSKRNTLRRVAKLMMKYS